MTTGNIIRPGDAIMVTVPLDFSPRKIEEAIQKLFPFIEVYAVPVKQDDIRVIAHYRGHERK